MKKIYTIAIASILMLSTQLMGQGFTIHGKIDGVSEGKVSLQARGGDKFATGIENGKFTLKGKVVDPVVHVLRVEGIRGSAQIFLDNSKIEFTADKDNLREAKVQGSKTHDIYNEYLNMNKNLSTNRRAFTV